MKKIEISIRDVRSTVEIPDNCQHPTPTVECNAINPREPECDCRWCVYNKEYLKANINP